MKKRKSRDEKPDQPNQPSIPSRWIVLGVLLVATVVTYSNSFGAAFVFDDNNTITRNASVRFGLFNWNLLSGRSLLYLTFTLNRELGGLDVWGYHAVNLALHAVNGVLVFLIAERVLAATVVNPRLSRIYAGFATGFFLLHPVQTESVTYISSRSELLSTAFYLLGLLAFIQWPQSPGFLCSLVVAAFYFLGVASKETAITLPAAIFLYDFLFLSSASLAALRSRWRFYATFLAGVPVAVYFLLTRILSGSIGGHVTGNLSNWRYFLTELRVLLRYIQIIFLPVGLNFDYDFRPSSSLFEPAVAVSLIVLALIVLLGWRERQRAPVFAFSIFWFFITLSPTSSFVPIADVIFEHRLYLPLAGICVSFPMLIDLIYGKLAKNDLSAA